VSIKIPKNLNNSKGVGQNSKKNYIITKNPKHPKNPKDFRRRWLAPCAPISPNLWIFWNFWNYLVFWELGKPLEFSSFFLNFDPTLWNYLGFFGIWATHLGIV